MTMTPEDEDLHKIEAQGWRQGCVLPVACHAEVAQPPELDAMIGPDDACIVVSQTCDLVHHDARQEPYAELLLTQPLTGPADSRLRNRRNPRRLHFELSVRGHLVGYEAWAWRRCPLRRAVLAHYQPDPERCLPDERGLRMIQEWLAGRYQRAALPSAFQRRLKPVQDKLRKLAAKLTDASILFIALSSQDELSDGEAYRLSVILALPAEEYAQQARLRAIEQLHMELMRLFALCAGVELDEAESRVESEENISLAALRYLLRWEEFDYVSYQDRTTHQPPYPGMG
ncbi:MAG: hypothetical protein WAT67_10740 [Candidatus Contendobacter sp.]